MADARTAFARRLAAVLAHPLDLTGAGNFAPIASEAADAEQNSTNAAFGKKWGDYNESTESAAYHALQENWYLTLYGFGDEAALAAFLRSKKVIYDAGCGLGRKAAWFARLAPESLVVGMDFSGAAQLAAHNHADLPNLFFLQGDIAAPVFRAGSMDYVSCDQVIMHTQVPEDTFAELARITEPAAGEFACYFYAKKALPRELLDDYFRRHCTRMSHEALMEMAEQLSELGKRLSALNARIDVPEIPALGIKGGEMDVQRFLYWNFLKCYWNETLGHETSTMVNFDWYSPSNARRFSKEEVLDLIRRNGMEIVSFHEEEACYSGRFSKKAVA